MQVFLMMKYYVIQCYCFKWLTFSSPSKNRTLLRFLIVNIIKKMSMAKKDNVSLQSYDGGFGLIPGQESHGECYCRFMQCIFTILDCS